MENSTRSCGESDINSSGLSMYLSFDSETTISDSRFNTLEGTNDFMVEENDFEAKDSSKLNNTLEASKENIGDFPNIETVKHQYVTNALPSKPLVALPKNILKECNVTSSTPTKEQLLRGVEVGRGSSSNDRLFQIRNAFNRMTVDKPLTNQLPIFDDDEPKEILESGILLEISSSSSHSSSLETVTSTSRNLLSEIENASEHKDKDLKQIITDETRGEKPSIIKKDLKVPYAAKEVKIKANSVFKNPIHTRKSICEPDLKKNRPSRILPQNKNRSSIAATNVKPNITKPTAKITEIMTSISEAKSVVQDKTDGKNLLSKPKHTIQKPEVTLNNKRSSLIPTSLGEKRPYKYSQRMSVVVQTTLNSPARKLVRKSVAASSQHQRFRRSVMPSNLETNKLENKSKLNQFKQTKDPIVPKVMVSSVPKNTGQMQSNLQIPKIVIGNTVAPPKPVKTYNCTICNQLFRIKSLFDAHKRSHEYEESAIVKKSLQLMVPRVGTIGNSFNIDGGDNKCVYCDKKFVLLHALHIHLMENCMKIPPTHKRKLQFTEMNHVEKAQLPVFSSNSINSSGQVDARIPSTGIPMAIKEARKSCLIPKPENPKTMAPPPLPATITKSTGKSKSARSGIVRTPNKSIPCHHCKRSFKNIIEYTDHMMTMHSTSVVAKNDSVEH